MIVIGEGRLILLDRGEEDGRQVILVGGIIRLEKGDKIPVPPQTGSLMTGGMVLIPGQIHTSPLLKGTMDDLLVGYLGEDVSDTDRWRRLDNIPEAEFIRRMKELHYQKLLGWLV